MATPAARSPEGPPPMPSATTARTPRRDRRSGSDGATQSQASSFVCRPGPGLVAQQNSISRLPQETRETGMLRTKLAYFHGRGCILRANDQTSDHCSRRGGIAGGRGRYSSPCEAGDRLVQPPLAELVSVPIAGLQRRAEGQGRPFFGGTVYRESPAREFEEGARARRKAGHRSRDRDAFDLSDVEDVR